MIKEGEKEMNGFESELFIMREMEKKLKELMSEEDYDKFALEIAQKAFIENLKHLPESEFKEFALNHVDEVFEEYEEFGDDTSIPITYRYGRKKK